MPITDPNKAARLSALAAGGTAGLAAFDDAQMASTGAYQQALSGAQGTALNGDPERQALAGIVDKYVQPALGNVSAGQASEGRQIGYNQLATQGFLARERASLDQKAQQNSQSLALQQQEALADHNYRMAKLSQQAQARQSAADRENTDAMLAGAAQIAQARAIEEYQRQFEELGSSKSAARPQESDATQQRLEQLARERADAKARMDAIARMAGEKITSGIQNIYAEQNPGLFGTTPGGADLQARNNAAYYDDIQQALQQAKATNDAEIAASLEESKRLTDEQVAQNNAANEQQQLAGDRAAMARLDLPYFQRLVAPAFGINELEALGRFASTPEELFARQKAQDEMATYAEDQAYKALSRDRSSVNAQNTVETQALADQIGWDPSELKAIAAKTNYSVVDVAEAVSSDAWAQVSELANAALDEGKSYEEFRTVVQGSEFDPRVKRLASRYFQPQFFSASELEGTG